MGERVKEKKKKESLFALSDRRLCRSYSALLFVMLGISNMRHDKTTKKKEGKRKRDIPCFKLQYKSQINHHGKSAGPAQKPKKRKGKGERRKERGKGKEKKKKPASFFYSMVLADRCRYRRRKKGRKGKKKKEKGPPLNSF